MLLFLSMLGLCSMIFTCFLLFLLYDDAILCVSINVMYAALFFLKNCMLLLHINRRCICLYHV
jgi:hypothetical protein